MSLFDGIRQIPGILGGVGRGIEEAVAGPSDPSLSPAQQEALKKRAFMQAGLAAMLSSGAQPVAPNIAQIFAQSALTGQQAYQQGAGQIHAQEGRQALQQAFGGQPLDRGKLQQLMVQLLSAGDMESAKLVGEQIKALPGPQVLSAGAQLRAPDGSLIADNPKAVDPLAGLPPELVGIAELMGVNPAQLAALPQAQRDQLMEQWRKNKESGATRVSFNPEQTTQRGVVDIAIDDYKGVQEAARAARARLAGLSQMQALLGQGMQTGGLQALTAPMRKVAASLGYDTENMSQQAVFQALAARMALDSKQGMTGPMSDKDIAFLQAMVPNLSNTPEGNRMLISVMSRLAQRDIALAAEANRYIAQHGTLDHRWLQHEQEWAGSQNLFGDLLNPAERAKFGY